jgi:hypothetical protein
MNNCIFIASLLLLLRRLSPLGKALLEKQLVVQLVKEILQLVWNSNAADHVHNSRPIILIVSFLNPIHTFPS